VDEEGIMAEYEDDEPGYLLTKKGLQFLIDRAHLRISIAEQEEDSTEASFAFAELFAFAQLALTYDWEMEGGQIR